MKRKLLKKIAVFGKKHNLPMNFIIFEFAVVIIFSHIGLALKKRKAVISVGCMIALLVILIASSIRDFNDGEKAYAEGTEAGTNKVELAEVEETTKYEPIKDAILNQEEIDMVTELLMSPEEEEEKYDSYYIKVNRKQNCITIYAPNEEGEYVIPIKAMICSTGGDKTPLGIYPLHGQRYEFRNLLFDVYGQYATRIIGQILFHSASYSAPQKDCLIAEEFNKLGDSVSHGCIRLTVEDAKWIHDNCETGTTIEIYEDDEPGPLGKPEMLKVPEGTLWDPTDESENNPWKDCTPIISGVADRDIELGTRLSYEYGISAVDTCGNNITDKIEIYGTVDINKRGKYMVVYYVKDLIGRVDMKTAVYTVK